MPFFIVFTMLKGIFQWLTCRFSFRRLLQNYSLFLWIYIGTAVVCFILTLIFWRYDYSVVIVSVNKTVFIYYNGNLFSVLCRCVFAICSVSLCAALLCLSKYTKHFLLLQVAVNAVACALSVKALFHLVGALAIVLTLFVILPQTVLQIIIAWYLFAHYSENFAHFCRCDGTNYIKDAIATIVFCILISLVHTLIIVVVVRPFLLI